MCKTLFLVIPCFNEEMVLPETSKRLDEKMRNMIKNNLICDNSKVFFVDDGSKDKTWEIIKQLHIKNQLFLGLRLSHNSGEQNAYIAGMMAVKHCTDMVITMDADLQDDIDAIDKMVNEYYLGNDIVYGVRSSRKKERFSTTFPAKAFYRIMEMMGTELIPNHSQYRLMSRRALDALSCYSEVNLFLPALIPLLGFKYSKVYHERIERPAGESKYSFGRLFSLAVEAITSFSTKPIHFINGSGFLFLFVSLCISVCLLVQVTAGKSAILLAILASVWAVGGTILLAVGIVGEYVGKCYSETKQRPRYIISESLLDESKK